MSQWYYAHDGKQSGPVPVSELQRLAADGKFDPEKDLVWREGQPDWKPATTIPELDSLFKKEAPSEPAAGPGTSPATSASSTPSPYESPQSPATASYSATSSIPGGPPSTGLAVGSMVCGLIGLLTCCAWYLALPLCITAVVLGHVSSSRQKNDPARFGGKGFSRSGMILGYTGIVLSLLAAAFSFYIITRTPEQLENMEWLPPEFRERFQEELERQNAR